MASKLGPIFDRAVYWARQKTNAKFKIRTLKRVTIDGAECYACTYFYGKRKPQIIYFDRSLNINEAIDTLLHELAHVEHNLSKKSSKKQETHSSSHDDDWGQIYAWWFREYYEDLE